jgi:hypothetical protein
VDGSDPIQQNCVGPGTPEGWCRLRRATPTSNGYWPAELI